jgi:hypothetical protein
MDSDHLSMNDETMLQLRSLLIKTRQALKVNKRQTRAKYIFELMEAIDDATKIMGDAWRISQTAKESNDYMRTEFVKIFENFYEMRNDLTKLTGENKH